MGGPGSKASLSSLQAATICGGLGMSREQGSSGVLTRDPGASKTGLGVSTWGLSRSRLLGRSGASSLEPSASMKGLGAATSWEPDRSRAKRGASTFASKEQGTCKASLEPGASVKGLGGLVAAQAVASSNP